MARHSTAADQDDDGTAVDTAMQDTRYAKAAKELRRLASRASSEETETEFAVLAQMYDKLADSHHRLESTVSRTSSELGSRLRGQRRAAESKHQRASNA